MQTSNRVITARCSKHSIVSSDLARNTRHSTLARYSRGRVTRSMRDVRFHQNCTVYCKTLSKALAEIGKTVAETLSLPNVSPCSPYNVGKLKVGNIFVSKIGSHALFVADLQFCACLIGKSMFLVLETSHTFDTGQTMKHCFRNKKACEFVLKHFFFPRSKI